MYESYYVRAVDPERPRGVWLRHTRFEAAGEQPVGSVWITLFDAASDGPLAHKVSVPGPVVPPGGWLRVGDSEIGPGRLHGPAWDLRWQGSEAPLRHLPRGWMYRSPLPRTKLESPLPAATFDGSVTVGGTTMDVAGWPGMVGHNWGAQHAERWIWLHGVAFDGAPDAWLDIALGRLKLGPATTPWIANGVLSVGGRRTRIGGLAAARRTRVREDPLRLDLEVPGDDASLRLTVQSPRADTVVWRYADPADRSEHHTANCSIAAMDAVFTPAGGVPMHLRTAHGAAYGLGMREATHGLPVQPFGDP
jgi:hypothetical protein